MEKINEQEFISELNKNINNNIKVNINGSIVTTLQLTKITINIRNDLIQIKGNEKDNFLEFNLNQVYKILFEKEKNILIIYIDDDIEIEIIFLN